MTERIKTIITAKDVSGSSTFKKFGASLISVNQGLELMGKAMRAVKATIGSVIVEGREFGKQMSAVSSVTKATAEDMKTLTDEARRLGATTAFTASQAGKAMEELGRAGLTTNKIIETTGEALNLAAANGVELAESAGFMAIQMNIFSKEGLKARRAADLINQTISSSPQNFEDFRYAMQFAAGTASAFNRSFAETTQIMGALAELGVRGSRAGTALSMAFARLGKPTAEAQKVLSKYGITLEQINPATNKFADIIDVLNKANLTQSEIFSVLGARTAPKFFKLIQAGGDTIRNFAEKQKGANTALEAAAVRLNNLDGDITIFNSAVSGLKLSIFDSLDDVLRSIVQGSTAMVGVFNQFVKNNQGELTSIFEGMAAGMEYVKDGIVLLVRGLGHLLEGVATLFMLEEFITLLKNWGEIFGLIKDIVMLLFPQLKKMGEYMGGKYFDHFLKVYKIMFRMGAVIQDVLIVGLKGLKQLIIDFPTIIDNVVTKFNNFVQAIKDTVTMVKDLVTSFGELSKNALVKVFTSYKKFVTESDKAVISMLKMDDVLVGNTLVPGFKQFAKNLFVTSKKMQNFTLETKKANKQAKVLDEEVTNINESLKGMMTGSIGLDVGFKDVGRSLTAVFKSGALLLSKEIKNAFSDPIGILMSVGQKAFGVVDSFVNTMMGLFKGNEKFAAAFNKIFETVGQVLAPIIEAFIPILTAISDGIKKLAPSLQRIATRLAPIIEKIVTIITDLMDELGPVLEEFTSVIFESVGKLIKAIAPIIGMVLKKVLPIITKFTDRMMPSIIKVIEGVGPLLSAIIDILDVIIEEITPALIEVNNVISELLPLLTSIMELVKEFLPLIKFIIQFLVNYTRFMSVQFIFVIRVLTAVINLVIDVIKTAVSVLQDLFTGVVSVIEDLIDAIGSMGDDLVSGVGGFFEGIGQGGDKGPDILDPTTWGFAQGTGSLTKDQLVHLPGMESNAGLVKAHVGESVGPANNSPIQLTFNIKAIDPRATSDELRRLLEELKATGKI